MNNEDKQVTKLCDYCRRSFSYYLSSYKNRRFCSKPCYSKTQEIERKGMKFTESHKKNLRLSSLGKQGYWLGKKRSEEDIKKFRVSHTGKKQSNETILKRIKRGKDHYNYQGGITTITRKRTRGIFWKRIADKIRERDNNICRSCGLNGKEKKLPVHHIIPFRISKNNDFQNLITLCPSCHIKFEKKIQDIG